MSDQYLSAWPDKDKIKKLNQIIAESHLNPFGIINYIPGQKITDFVGRSHELEMMKDEISIVFQHQISKAIRLEGPGGVGKSTLFNYIKESIEKERSSHQLHTHYILEQSDIFSTYFNVPSKIAEFSDIWKPMMEGMVSGFEEETGHPISLPEYVVFHLIYEIFRHYPDQMAEIIWSKSQRPANLNLITFKEIIEPLLNQGGHAVKKLQDFYKIYKNELRNHLKREINGISYKIDRDDNNKILNLFRVIDEDDNEQYLESIKQGKAEFLNNNEKIIGFFNDLMRYYTCATGKRPLLLIGIDEFAKADPFNKEDYYHQLANLLIRLRNDLKYILFVFISTTEDWAQFDEAIGQTDTASQLNGFVKRILVNQLSIDEVCLIFQNRMNNFWVNYASDRPTNALYYPFTKSSFEYIYRYEKRNLRNCLNLLKELWSWLRNTKTIPKMETTFETMAVIRQFKKIEFNITQLQPHDWKIIHDTFCAKPEITNNAKKSSLIEKGIEKLFQCLQLEQPTKITRVENNPTIKTKSGNRRPDIYVQISGNLGAEFRRQIEFQIKAYSDNSFVELANIESSLQLFEENYTDLIYFIITGRGLSPDAEKKVKEIECKYTNRIIRPPLNENQINHLYLLAMFEEVAGYPLGQKSKTDIQIAKNFFSVIFNQNFESFIAEVEKLSYRKIEDIVEPLSPQKPIIDNDSKISIHIDQFIGIENTAKDDIKDAENILSERYPDLVPYCNELLALCKYLKNRETGKYRLQFTAVTVRNNVIMPDASLSKSNFDNLIKKMVVIRLVEQVKTSYKLTKPGEDLYRDLRRWV